MKISERSFQIGLISPYSNLSAIGLRYISASLQAAGYSTRLIFLPNPDELYYKAKSPPQQYDEATLDQVCELCSDLDIVGITLMSNYVGRARSLTQAIRERLGLPIIWGGIHPTIKPEECLQWADFVCVGEGEEAIVELVRGLEIGQAVASIPNIWARDQQGRPIPNPSRPIYQDLDELALPDYDLTDHHILHKGRIISLTQPLMGHYLLHNFAHQTRLAYMLSATRGCPFRCAFCCDNALTKMFAKWSKLRRRSPENLVAEIKAIQTILPNLEAIMFIDSTFLAVQNNWLNHFAEVYRREIGLPFFIQTTPGSIKEDKIRLLVEAGLVDVGMGLQTGSARVRTLYQRFETNEQILEAGRILQQYQTAIPYPSYDIISDNPYETNEDKLETLRLLYQLPRPHLLHFFSLTFYPGTDMYEKAKEDGLVEDDERDVYAKSYIKLIPNYYNFLLWCLHRNWPRWLLWLMIQPLTLKVFSSRYTTWLFELLYRGIALSRGLHAHFRHLRQTPLATRS